MTTGFSGISMWKWNMYLSIRTTQKILSRNWNKFRNTCALCLFSLWPPWLYHLDLTACSRDVPRTRQGSPSNVATRAADRLSTIAQICTDMRKTLATKPAAPQIRLFSLVKWLQAGRIMRQIRQQAPTIVIFLFRMPTDQFSVTL